jgi:hypothetical protein
VFAGVEKQKVTFSWQQNADVNADSVPIKSLFLFFYLFIFRYGLHNRLEYFKRGTLELVKHKQQQRLLLIIFALCQLEEITDTFDNLVSWLQFVTI